MGLKTILTKNAWNEIEAQNKELLTKNGLNSSLKGLDFDFCKFMVTHDLNIRKQKFTQEIIDQYFLEKELNLTNNSTNQIISFMKYKQIPINKNSLNEDLLNEYDKIKSILDQINTSEYGNFFKFLEENNIDLTNEIKSSELFNEFLSYSTKNMNDTKYLYNHAKDVIKMNMDFVSKARLEGFKVEVNIGGERESHLKKIGAYGQLAGLSGANLGAMLEPDLKTMKVKCRIAPKGIRLTPWKSNELFDLRIPWETIRQVSTSSKGLLLKTDETTVSFIMENQNEIKPFWALIVDNTNLTVEDDGW